MGDDSYADLEDRTHYLTRNVLGDLSVFPIEILLNTLSFLTPRELVPVFQVCKRLNQIASDDGLWKSIFALRADFKKARKLVNSRRITWKQMFHKLRKETLSSLTTSQLEMVHQSRLQSCRDNDFQWGFASNTNRKDRT